MPDTEIVNQKIQHPIQHHISAAAHSIAEYLLRHKSTERSIEKIDDFGYKLCECLHLSNNCRTFAAEIQFAKVLLNLQICK